MMETDISADIRIVGFPEGRKEIGGEKNIERNNDDKLLKIKKEQRLQIERANRIPRRKDMKTYILVG